MSSSSSSSRLFVNSSDAHWDGKHHPSTWRCCSFLPSFLPSSLPSFFFFLSSLLPQLFTYWLVADCPRIAEINLQTRLHSGKIGDRRRMSWWNCTLRDLVDLLTTAYSLTRTCEGQPGVRWELLFAFVLRSLLFAIYLFLFIYPSVCICLSICIHSIM